MPWNMKKTDEKTGEIRIYGLISDLKFFEDDTTPTDFQKDLDSLGKIENLKVYINSPGGGVFAGFAIYNIIKRSSARVTTVVDGQASSIAAVILQAGDERTSAKNGMIFVHEAMGCMCGYADDMRKYANELDKVQESLLDSFDRVDLSRQKIVESMKNETLMTAKEALQMGFIDRIEDRAVKSKVENKKVTYDDVTYDYRNFKGFDVSKLEGMAYEPPNGTLNPPACPEHTPEPLAVPDEPIVDYREHEYALVTLQNRMNSVLINHLNLSKGVK